MPSLTITIATTLAGGACALAGNLFASSLQRRHDLIRDRRNAAVKLYARIGECLAHARFGGELPVSCVDFECYAAFRLSLGPDEGRSLDECWNEYVENRASKTACIPCLECLLDEVRDATKT